MSNFSIRLHLEECHQVKVADGGKATCPFCQHYTLSIKGDELGKCFHPSCGRFINQHTVQSNQAHLQQFFWSVMEICQNALSLQVKDAKALNHSAYRYLVDERKVHPEIIHNSPVLGVIPPSVELEVCIQNFRNRLQEETELKSRDALLKEFDEQTHTLKDFLARHSGWLVFGYTNAAHKLISFKFREPYSKKFAQFKPTEQTGVFNPIPFDTGENRLFPYVLLAEGEFNILSLQSLLFQNGLSPAQAMAVGSASGVDWYNLQGFKEKWPWPVHDGEGDQLGRRWRICDFQTPCQSLPEKPLVTILQITNGLQEGACQAKSEYWISVYWQIMSSIFFTAHLPEPEPHLPPTRQ
jgi:hypothetical protein